MPGWFKRLPGLDYGALSVENDGLTVKRCVPFLDAMTTGWIIPLAATVRLEISGEGTSVRAGWEYDREMVSTHNAHQAAGNPWEPRPLMKFHNPWTIRTPPGWSCLFLPPVNRPSPVFEILSGIVDTDTYVSTVNLPFVATGADGLHTLQQGAPLAQVIPFERDGGRLEAEIRAETPDEYDERERIRRATQAGQGWYRDNARAPRTAVPASNGDGPPANG